MDGKGYKWYPDLKENQRITPRKIKVDIYNDRPIKEVPIEVIVNTAEIVPVGKQKKLVRVVNLNVFILLKHRAGRNHNDLYDLRLIAEKKFDDIDWDFLKTLTKNEAEFQMIKNTIKLNHERH